MARQYDSIPDRLRRFIEAQKIFFVATAAPDGRINLSPKGLDTLRVMDEQRVVWLNLTGSGNETAARLLESPRITLMFTAFEGDPMILRLYGEARAIHRRDAEWSPLAALFPRIPGARRIIDMRVGALVIPRQAAPTQSAGRQAAISCRAAEESPSPPPGGR